MLVMSATPIPRTLAIILYGDLHLSVVNELPAERLPVKNCVVGTSYRPKAYEFIVKEVRKGNQAFVICPMVEAGEEENGLENVTDYGDRLRARLPRDIHVEILHGKMKSADKQRIMDAFGAVGAKSGLIRELCPAVETAFPIVRHDHSSSIRRSTSRYRLAGFTRVQCSMIRPIRPSASRLEGCWPVSITFISTPRE